jgi:hypothetical protein
MRGCCVSRPPLNPNIALIGNRRLNIQLEKNCLVVLYAID